MRHDTPLWRALVLGIFVVAAVSLAAYGVFAVGQHEWRFPDTFTLDAPFANVGGIEKGSRVQVQGMDAGVVEAILPPAEPGGLVTLRLRIDENLRPLVRTDAVARLANQGLVGAKVVEIAPGSPAAATISPGATIETETPIAFDQVLARADDVSRQLHESGQALNRLLARVDRLAAGIERGEGTLGKLATSDEAHQSALAVLESAESTLANLDALTAQVRAGEGTLGKLVTSDDAYHSALETLDTSEQMMRSIDESMVALRRVWPLESHFRKQGMNDVVDVLYRPNARRTVRQIPAGELFHPGRSTLTDTGRRRLDAFARWLNSIGHEGSEIVVAAFDQQLPNHSKAQRLTQLQAAAVRDYLVDEHDVHKLGWLARREVTAAGFGNQVPDDQTQSAPAQRVELIVFVPES